MGLNELKMYCISIDENDLKLIEELKYIPVGLGSSNFSDKWIKDNRGVNISEKNKWYSELTFHYYFWKNEIKSLDEKTWVGFCAYRDFWVNEFEYNKYLKNTKLYQANNRERFNDIKKIVLQNIPQQWNDYETIIGDELSLENVKFMKIFKYGKISLLRNPKAIFKSGRSIRWHFDMYHGNGILDQAINLLDESEKKDFKKYVKEKTSFNRGCMFICRSKKTMDLFYNFLFSWLERCEKVFGFDLEGYGRTRLYAFLAERYMPYWFKKYSKYLVWPVLTFNIPRKKISN